MAAWLRAVLLCGFVLSAVALPAQTAVPPSPQELTSSTGTASVDIGSLRGVRVRAIDFQGFAVENPDRLRALIAQKVGEPLDKFKVRESIQTLYATGRFADIRVDAQRDPQDPGQVTLIFVAQENYFIGAITLDGVPRGGLRYSQLINAAKLDLGSLYSKKKIDDAVAGIHRALEDGGYYRATVTPQFVAHAEQQQLDIHFHIVPGPQARIGSVDIKGDPGMLPVEVLRVAHMQPGSKASQERVTKALERLRKHYSKADRIEAQVAMTNRAYDSANNTVNYTF